jgi:hypothetical protein
VASDKTLTSANGRTILCILAGFCTARWASPAVPAAKHPFRLQRSGCVRNVSETAPQTCSSSVEA